ncbi:hypothetical protein SAY87_003303 [Trapa incisa]|uniref:Auxin efflux carrier component n=1 Tax=Trapa incisa TaxID=236973 RepID=A0AAN7KKN3_9MYRT|nr:hypothetical protein SAY87_003303 [Trapa incisa]
MITATDIYHVMTAMVPLYVAMTLAYGSVKWWKIFTPAQCSGINRFVALFAVPLLSFHFISTNNPYTMNLRFIAADTLQKLIVLVVLFAWCKFSNRGCLEWTITLFSVSTLPNTLVMGIPLLKGMYGDFSGSLMVQIVVLQCIIWYTLMLFLFEYRGAKMLISEQFPGTAGSIVSIHVDSDVMSLDGRQPLETDAQLKEDGKLHVTVRRSNASRSDIFSRKSMGLSSTTPRPSNLTNAEIYSLQSSRNPTPRGSSFNYTDFYSMMGGGGAPGQRNSNFDAGDVYGLPAALSRPTPRPSNYEEDAAAADGGARKSRLHSSYPPPNLGMFSPKNNAAAGVGGRKQNGSAAPQKKGDEGGRGLHMFVWSSSASPVSDVFRNGNYNDFGGGTNSYEQKEVRVAVSPVKDIAVEKEEGEYLGKEEFSFANRSAMENGNQPTDKADGNPKAMPPTSVMTRLILIMVWRKLIRNPNTYSSLIGLTWSLVCFRWNVQMPKIIAKSISILSDAGLGMAMFSLGYSTLFSSNTVVCGGGDDDDGGHNGNPKRQLYHRGLFPLSSQRSTMYTLTFSAQGEEVGAIVERGTQIANINTQPDQQPDH